MRRGAFCYGPSPGSAWLGSCAAVHVRSPADRGLWRGRDTLWLFRGILL